MSSRYYRWDPELKQIVELGARSLEASIAIQTDASFEGLRASDGTDISSRTKWKQYMDDHGLTIANDFKETWEKAAKDREARTQPGYGREERIETLKRVMEMNPRDVSNIARNARERGPHLPHPVGLGWEDY